VNIPEIDAQHKTLIEKAGKLDTLLRADYLMDSLLPQFKELLELAAVHFATEEKLMENYGFPGLADHRRDHEEIVKHAHEIMERNNRSKELLYMMGILDFVGNWLMGHIRKTDQEYARFIHASGAVQQNSG
jgi:hemerythrin-like metal-binding protein